MLCQFQVYSKVIQLYIYMCVCVCVYSFSYSFPLQVIFLLICKQVTLMYYLQKQHLGLCWDVLNSETWERAGVGRDGNFHLTTSPRPSPVPVRERTGLEGGSRESQASDHWSDTPSPTREWRFTLNEFRLNPQSNWQASRSFKEGSYTSYLCCGSTLAAVCRVGSRGANWKAGGPLRELLQDGEAGPELRFTHGVERHGGNWRLFARGGW